MVKNIIKKYIKLICVPSSKLHMGYILIILILSYLFGFYLALNGQIFIGMLVIVLGYSIGLINTLIRLDNGIRD